MESDLPVARTGVSGRSRGVALALALVGGPLGLHRFYAGRRASGVAMILTIGGLGIWWLYDVVTLASGEFRDVDGLRLRRWQVEDEPDVVPQAAGRVDTLVDQVDRLEREVAELGERVDFMERLLAQQRDRERLPRG